MSREALSIEISRAVALVVRGQPIDAAEHGASLAAKYPDLGMSGEMISEAIVRAANMIGMIKSAPMPVAWPDATPESAPVMPPAPSLEVARPAHPALPEVVPSIEDDLAFAIDAEISNLVTGRVAEETEPPSREPARADREPPRMDREPPREIVITPPAEPRRFAPVAAFRRAFFRH